MSKTSDDSNYNPSAAYDLAKALNTMTDSAAPEKPSDDIPDECELGYVEVPDPTAELIEDDYLPVPEQEPASETVTVQDFDPDDPGAAIVPPQKVLVTNDRRTRKHAQRVPLDKSSLDQPEPTEDE